MASKMTKTLFPLLCHVSKKILCKETFKNFIHYKSCHLSPLSFFR